MLLSINIPTYERLNSFCSVLDEISNEIIKIDEKYINEIEINIIDNDSKCYKYKEQYCEEIKDKYKIKLTIKKNEKNIGADRNIQKCCNYSLNSTYTWVFGDDDHLYPDTLEYIINILESNIDDLNLLILKTNEYNYNTKISEKKIFESYYDFALMAVKEQPHLLIAHTLISCNIFRSKIFNLYESDYYLKILRKRYGNLNIGFSHMRGILSDTLKIKKKIILTSKIIIDINKREKDTIHGEQIFQVYYFYYIWLLSEIGVRIDQIIIDKSMQWIERGYHYNYIKIIYKVHNKIKNMIKEKLINIFGHNIFNKINRWRK